MTPTPITPPGGGAVTPTQHPGNSYVGSGICSGTAFTHTQSIFISYKGAKESTIANTWLPSAGADISGLLCDVYVQYTDSLDQFSNSANDGSSCANAANTREMHVLDISGYNWGLGGFGYSGNINTSSTGFTRRWAQPGDTEEQYARFYTKCWFPLDDGTYNASILNDTVAAAVVRRIVEQIASGGVPYDGLGGQAGGDISPPIPKFSTNLIYI